MMYKTSILLIMTLLFISCTKQVKNEIPFIPWREYQIKNEYQKLPDQDKINLAVNFFTNHVSEDNEFKSLSKAEQNDIYTEFIMKIAKDINKGSITWPDGTKYEGQWKDGQFDGQGTLSKRSGIKYVGRFKNGKYEGQGILTLADGKKYNGQWKNGLQHGQGTLTTPKGSKYSGQWDEGNIIGYGYGILVDQTDDNGDFVKRVYTGNFFNGKPEGKGTSITYDQFGNIRVKYIGPFKEGKRFGKGVTYFYDRNGRITETETGWYDGDYLGEE